MLHGHLSADTHNLQGLLAAQPQPMHPRHSNTLSPKPQAKTLSPASLTPECLQLPGLLLSDDAGWGPRWCASGEAAKLTCKDTSHHAYHAFRPRFRLQASRRLGFERARSRVALKLGEPPPGLRLDSPATRRNRFGGSKLRLREKGAEQRGPAQKAAFSGAMWGNRPLDSLCALSTILFLQEILLSMQFAVDTS